jgi:signal transduction histidine kinase
MSGIFLLDWAIMAVSLFNTITSLWLGITVLLNAERRGWGMWLVSGGLLSGAAFFLSHSIIVGLGLSGFVTGMDFWWHLGWIPVVLAPFAWYLVMLWYAGFWETKVRHRRWFPLVVLTTAVILVLLVFENPLPSFSQISGLDLDTTLSLEGVPVLMLIYPLDLLLCIGLSLDALARPGPAGRVMSHLARQRARPWLIAATISLMLVSFMVAWVMLWVFLNANQPVLNQSMVRSIAWFDLLISLLIGLAIFLTGQALVSHEVFTGKVLPRRGLVQYWRRALILAAGYGVVMGCSLTLSLQPIYSLLLSTLLMIVFYALLVWRSYAERERFIASLRPFVTSQNLYGQLLAQGQPAASSFDAQVPFKALCQDILETRFAWLFALGHLKPLFSDPLVYPNQASTSLPGVTELSNLFTDPKTLCVPLEVGQYADANWAVPLWSTQGLTGVLLLGEKRDGGLYTQEEIEIARSVGERLMDTQASSEMARRLMSLQRQRLAESQVLDRQTRRVLHDDVLPLLHTTMLTLNTLDNASHGHIEEETTEAISLLSDAHHKIADLLHEMPTNSSTEVNRLGLFCSLRKVLEEELAQDFEAIEWRIPAQAEEMAASIPSLTKEVLFYAAREAMRNAARHGRGPHPDSPLNLHFEVNCQNGLEISIRDNGIGVGGDPPAKPEGGHGLALHTTMMAVVGGSLSLESVLGEYTCVSLHLPRSAW